MSSRRQRERERELCLKSSRGESEEEKLDGRRGSVADKTWTTMGLVSSRRGIGYIYIYIYGLSRGIVGGIGKVKGVGEVGEKGATRRV